MTRCDVFDRSNKLITAHENVLASEAIELCNTEQAKAEGWYFKEYKPCFFAIGYCCWGKGSEPLQALKQAKANYSYGVKEAGVKAFALYEAHTGCYVSEMGALQWPMPLPEGIKEPKRIYAVDYNFKPVKE